jgi:hypothetical protein
MKREGYFARRCVAGILGLDPDLHMVANPSS